MPPGCASLTYISAADEKWWWVHFKHKGVAAAIFSVNPFKNALVRGLEIERKPLTLHFSSFMVNLSGLKSRKGVILETAAVFLHHCV